MILSDRGILQHIESRDIAIDPFNEGFLKPASYSLTLNGHLSIPKFEGLIDTKFLKGDNIEYEKIPLTEEGYIIEPGQFVLGQPKEKVSISNKLGYIFDARTTLAIIGLNVLQGSILVEPGQKDSHEILEIKNISQNPIKVYPGMKIVKCIFFQLNTPSELSYADMGTFKQQKKF